MSRMQGASARRKGEPVWVLVAIIGGWIGVRAATWEVTGIDPGGDLGFMRAATRHDIVPVRPAPAPLHFVMVQAPPPPFRAAMNLPAMPLVRPAPYASEMLRRPAATAGPDMGAMGTMGALGGHELLWMAAMANMPLAYDLARRGAQAHAAVFAEADVLPASVAGKAGMVPAVELVSPRAAPWLEPAVAPSLAKARLAHWSGDAWGLWRQGGGAMLGGPLLLPSYGANQVGAVLRYRLAPASGYKPTVYTRVYGALNGSGEREVAVGLSARPLPRLPVVAMVEGRVSRFDNGSNHLRSAVTLVSELPPMMLPGAMRAEAYVQGGYVGGLGATPFIDGQFRLEHIADRQGRAELRVGGGVWGGAQQGAQRLDVGPTATVAFATARAGAHVSVDWRFRVEGNAIPGSGPAVTLAAGF